MGVILIGIANLPVTEMAPFRPSPMMQVNPKSAVECLGFTNLRSKNGLIMVLICFSLVSENKHLSPYLKSIYICSCPLTSFCTES